MTPRNILVTAALVAAGGTAVFWLARPPAVGVVPVARRDIAPVIQAVGTVEANNRDRTKRLACMEVPF